MQSSAADQKYCRTLPDNIQRSQTRGPGSHRQTAGDWSQCAAASAWNTHPGALPAGMAASSLQPLLEGAGLDCFASHVLPLLSLCDLGRLASTSRLLRAVVADVPESVWAASAWHSQPHPQHPIHSAASCPAYLRRQHAVHAAIDTGRGDLTTLEGSCWPAPDMTKSASFAPAASEDAQQDRIQLLDLPGGGSVAVFDVPAHDEYLQVRPMTWDPASRRIALPWGEIWENDTYEEATAGICVLDTQTGAVSEFELDQQPRQTLFRGWTPCGWLLIRHLVAQRLVWSAFTADGAVQRRTASCWTDVDDEEACKERLVLAPSGTHAALSDEEGAIVLLWHMVADSSTRLHWPFSAGNVTWLLWSPCSCTLLGLCSEGRALLWDMDGAIQFSVDLGSCPAAGAWSGDALAVPSWPWPLTELSTDPPLSCNRLRTYRVQDSRLHQEASFDLAAGCASEVWHFRRAALSPDWQHVAVTASAWASGQRVACQVHVYSTCSLRLCMSHAVPDVLTRLLWAPSGAVLVCLGWNSLLHVKFDA